jgi:sugar lactone lactonase YvrE
MAGRVSPQFRGAGALLVLLGGVTLLGHPGAAAPDPTMPEKDGTGSRAVPSPEPPKRAVPMPEAPKKPRPIERRGQVDPSKRPSEGAVPSPANPKKPRDIERRGQVDPGKRPSEGAVPMPSAPKKPLPNTGRPAPDPAKIQGDPSAASDPGSSDPGSSNPGSSKPSTGGSNKGIGPKAPNGRGTPVPTLPTKPNPIPPGVENVGTMVPPPGNQIMPVSEVKAGMKGYGLTVFHGTALEKFGVEVIGVMPKAYMGAPLVLVRLSGGPITGRGAFLIQGMSGSPIYINGKLLGAFSMGDQWPKEPIGMVTPAENMLEALDPKLSERPAGQSAFDLSSLAAMASAETGIFQSPLQMANVTAMGHSFRPLAIPVSVSGLSTRNLDRVAQVLQPFNMAVMQGPGAMDKPFKASLSPGAGIGVALMTGDVDMTGIGTVTYRDGDRLLAFGHPMMQLGAAQFPISTVWIHDVFPGMPVSYKMGSGGELVGTLTQDRPFSIAGKVGPLPAMVPVRCSVTDTGTGRSRTFNIKTANHPLLVGQLLPIAVNQGLFQMRPVPGDAVAHVKLTVETEGAGTITRENVFYDPAAIDVVAVRELQELMGLLSNNSFRRVPVKSLGVDVTYDDGRPTATVDRIFLPQDKYEPGDDVTVNVALRPYRKDPVILKTKVHIPESAANGRAVLMVQGGATRVSILPPMSGGLGGLLPQSPPPDSSLRQVLKRFTDRERNTQVVSRLVFPSNAVNVRGERLSQLPSVLMDVMRSSKTTGLRMERDETKVLQDTDYIVDGLQTLEITIERQDRLEKGKGGVLRPGGASTGTGLAVPAGSTRGNLSVSEDAEDLGVLRFSVNGEPRSLPLSRPLPAARPRVRAMTPEDDEVEDTPKAKDEPKKAEGKKDEGTKEEGGSKDGDAGKSEKKDPKKKEGRKKDDGKAKNGSKKDHAKDKKGETPALETAKTSDEDKPTLGAASEDKLIGRQATIWTQTTQGDFERGTLTNAAVSTSGEVRLAPGLRLLNESAEQFVWSVAGVNGAVFAGTGNSGLVLKVAADGQATPFFRTGELEVHALARDKAGNLYAGTSPNGKIFRISPDGHGTELFSMNGTDAASDAGGKFVFCLAVAEDGTVYAGTGPNARVYRIKPGQTGAEEVCSLPTKSVMSLLLAKGVLYAGTAEDGGIYRIDPGVAGGQPTMVYDTDQTTITGLAADAAGNLYAACAPSGDIYRIEPDGTPRLHFDKNKATPFGLLSDPGGTLYTASGNSLLRIEPDGAATLVSERRSALFTCLAWDDQGRLIAGSSNVGSVYRLAPSVTGTFESTIHDAKLPARWGRMRYTGVLPDGGTLTVETRSGNTPEPDSTWSPWQAAVVKETSQFVASPPARFLQYRVLFQAERGSPALRDIAISYLPRNQAPKLTLVSPAGGEIWKGSQTLKWTAVDPDADTLTYEVAYSGDGGKTWKPVGEKVADSTVKAPSEGPRPTRSDANDALDRFRKELDADTSLSPQERNEKYDRAKALVEKYLQENPPTASEPGKTTSKTDDKSASSSKASGVTRQATISWDTKTVPDGIYILRIVASDKASNPGEPLSDTRTSEPFIISNTPPQVFLFEKGITVDAASKTVTVTGFTSGRVALKGAQYRVGDGDWTAIEPEDGIWDSAFEHFRFTIPTTNSGEQTLEVKVVDAAGNAQTSKIKFKTP